MMYSKILSKQELQEKLLAYYEKHFGKRDTDRWFESAALNVIMFEREGKIIALKCHILTGKVTEH